MGNKKIHKSAGELPLKPFENYSFDDKDHEECILCGKDAGIPFSAPIEGREYFIVGCGQLCKNCYNLLYGADISEMDSFEKENELPLLPS